MTGSFKKHFKDQEQASYEIISLLDHEHLGRAINIDTLKKLKKFQLGSSAK